jgi:hypothetical protein
VEQREPDRLLQLLVALDLDVGAAPEVVEVLRWSASRPSQPVCIAPVSPAATWSRSAGTERSEDQP